MPKNKTMEIEIEGIGPMDVGKIPPMVNRIRDYLDKYPDGKVMPSPLLASRLNVALSHFRGTAHHPLLLNYRCKSGRDVFYGNKKTIAALKEKLKA